MSGKHDHHQLPVEAAAPSVARTGALVPAQRRSPASHHRQPATFTVSLPEGSRYAGEIVDTWTIPRSPLPDLVGDGDTIRLLHRPYLAVILRRLAD